MKIFIMQVPCSLTWKVWEEKQPTKDHFVKKVYFQKLFLPLSLILENHIICILRSCTAGDSEHVVYVQGYVKGHSHEWAETTNLSHKSPLDKVWQVVRKTMYYTPECSVWQYCIKSVNNMHNMSTILSWASYYFCINVSWRFMFSCLYSYIHNA